MTQIIVCFTIYYSVRHDIFFFILLCLQAIVVSGKISLNVTMFTKVFGIKYFGFIYSVCTGIGGLFHLLGPFIIEIVVKDLKDYKKLFAGGGLCCMVLQIILINFSEEKFKYKMNEEEKDNEIELNDA